MTNPAYLRMEKVLESHPEYGRDKLARAAEVSESMAQRHLKKVKAQVPLPPPRSKSRIR